MRNVQATAHLLLLLVLLLVPLPSGRALAEAPEGIRWEGDVAAGLTRAATEGRPVLFAVNALEGEGANERLRGQAYPSAAWGSATREYVAFVANAGTHGDATCQRYGSIPCSAHRDAWSHLVRLLAPVERALISPQHVVLEPDGGLAYRKQYYTGVVTPDLLERLWVQISPGLAYEAAGTERRERLDALEAAKPDEVTDVARAWLGAGDPLAAAGLLRALDFADGDQRRRAIAEAFDAALPMHRSSVDLLADELGAQPDEDADLALTLAEALLASDRPAGVALALRVAVRSRDAAVRRRALALVTPEGTRELALVAEARLLLGAQAKPPDAAEVPAHLQRRLERALHPDLQRYPSLVDAMSDGPPAALAGALLEAAPAEILAQVDAVRRLLATAPFRIRSAASVALLGAGADSPDLAVHLWWAVQDPLEGPRWRDAATARLGHDPGDTWEVWQTAVATRLGAR